MSSSLSSGKSCHHISLDVIKDATNNFDAKNVLGSGGEGTVYFAKIKLGDDITQVAVKYLNINSKGFEDEKNTMSQIQHPNIVSLLGFCDESGQKFLIYEYMENKSLAGYVKIDSISLSWMQRLHICLDASRGIQRLHVPTDEYAKGIIHRDIKPANILLDNNWVAKISDFGLFKKSCADQLNSNISTNHKGTVGYHAPESILSQTVSRKTDVYAFGVVLFQVLCRKMPWDRGETSYTREEDEDIGIWAMQNVDNKIKEEISDGSLMAFAAIIRESLKFDAKERPEINEVVLALEEALISQECHVEAIKAKTVAEAIGAESRVNEAVAESVKVKYFMPHGTSLTGAESVIEYFNQPVTSLTVEGSVIEYFFPVVNSLMDSDRGLTELTREGEVLMSDGTPRAQIQGSARDDDLAEPDPGLNLIHGITPHDENGEGDSQSQSEPNPSAINELDPINSYRVKVGILLTDSVLILAVSIFLVLQVSNVSPSNAIQGMEILLHDLKIFFLLFVFLGSCSSITVVVILKRAAPGDLIALTLANLCRWFSVFMTFIALTLVIDIIFRSNFFELHLFPSNFSSLSVLTGRVMSNIWPALLCIFLVKIWPAPFHNKK